MREVWDKALEKLRAQDHVDDFDRDLLGEELPMLLRQDSGFANKSWGNGGGKNLHASMVQTPIREQGPALSVRGKVCSGSVVEQDHNTQLSQQKQAAVVSSSYLGEGRFISPMCLSPKQQHCPAREDVFDAKNMTYELELDGLEDDQNERGPASVSTFPSTGRQIFLATPPKNAGKHVAQPSWNWISPHPSETSTGQRQ